MISNGTDERLAESGEVIQLERRGQIMDDSGEVRRETKHFLSLSVCIICTLCSLSEDEWSIDRHGRKESKKKT